MSTTNAPQFTPKRIAPTAEQTAIQTAQQRVILIDANAGAAKTTTLALRIAESMHRGRAPEKILGLVFTAAAKQALKLRLKEIGVAAPLIARMTIATFDDYARTILAGLEFHPTDTFDSYEAMYPYAIQALEQVAEKYAERYPLTINASNSAIMQFLKLQLRTKARMDFHRPEFEQGSIEDRLFLLPDVSLTSLLWMAEYERVRGGDTGEVRFRAAFDATYDLVRLMEDDEELRASLPEFQVIVADELHDLNEASFRFLTMLIRRSGAFFCGAGDKDQVIYTWSGADHQFLRERFGAEFPKLQSYPLTSSYRYGPELAEAVASLKAKESASALARGTQIDLLTYDAADRDACTAQLVAAIRRWNADGHDSGGVAVLLRDRDQSVRVENALFQNNIGYRFVEMHSYLASQEILMLRALVALARRNLHWVGSAQRRADIFEALVFFTEIPYQRDELKQAKIDIANYPEMLEGFLDNHLKKSANNERASITAQAVEYLRGLDDEMPVGVALEHVVQLMKLDEAARRIYVDKAQADVVTRSIAGFIDVCGEAEVTLAAFPEWLAAMEQALADSAQHQRVTIACIDQIKGLEYAHVIMPYLSATEFPRLGAAALEEQNRFYVGITRAKDRLTLLAPADNGAASAYIAAMDLAQSGALGTRLLRTAQLRAEIARQKAQSR
ncbi:ATP-dependent helicase [Rugamonas sp.]|uniref:UvrD-helicase domain-containing protein n=1 Tax=Rugamonas sp. TaxID=1926287 RepID=UPI0025EEBDAF|nr:ATP-dependent helicase [Rugamonas sp.]